MSRTIPDVGALGGLYGLPLPRGTTFLFSRYAWASKQITEILGSRIIPLWLDELWENEGVAGDTINWTPFRRRVILLAHLGKDEHEFAVQVATRAADAGVRVFFRTALPEEIYTKVERPDSVVFAEEFKKNTDLWLTERRRRRWLRNSEPL